VLERIEPEPLRAGLERAAAERLEMATRRMEETS
jgi:hypothetical protein